MPPGASACPPVAPVVWPDTGHLSPSAPCARRIGVPSTLRSAAVDLFDSRPAAAGSATGVLQTCGGAQECETGQTGVPTICLDCLL